MITYLAKFCPNLSTHTSHLRELEKKGIIWTWDHEHRQQFARLKEMITEAPTLKYYKMDEPVTIQCDASSTGLGATLLQNDQPVAYASRALTKAEKQYA